MNDQEWIHALKLNKEEAKGKLWNILKQLGSDLKASYRYKYADVALPDFENIVHDAMLTTYKKILNKGIYQFRFDSSFEKYIKSIFYYKLIREIKNHLKNKSLSIQLDEQSIKTPPYLSPQQIMKILESCLQKLKTRERYILLKRHFNNRSPSSIAEELDLTRENVNTIAHRARKTVKKCLRKKGYKNLDDFLGDLG